MTKKVFLASLGQIVGCDVYKSIAAFTDISVQSSALPYYAAYPIYYMRTSYKYAQDLYSTGNIEKYKKGEITTPEFLEYMGSIFPKHSALDAVVLSEADPLETYSHIVHAWNAMCNMTTKSKEKFIKISEYLAENKDTSLVVASATNELHLSYNIWQLRKVAWDAKVEILIDTASSFSLIEGTTDIRVLATKAIQSFDSKDTIVHSFLREVRDKEDINVKHAEVTYHPYSADSSRIFSECLHRDCSLENQDMDL